MNFTTEELKMIRDALNAYENQFHFYDDDDVYWKAVLALVNRITVEALSQCCPYHSSGGDMDLSCGGDTAKENSND